MGTLDRQTLVDRSITRQLVGKASQLNVSLRMLMQVLNYAHNLINLTTANDALVNLELYILHECDAVFILELRRYGLRNFPVLRFQNAVART